MLDGRVKTLHPAIHGGILARRDRPDDLAGARAPRHRPRRRRRRQPLSVRRGGGESRDAVRRARRGDRHRRAVARARGGQELPRRARRRRSGGLRARARGARSTRRASAFRFELARKAIAHTAAYDTASPPTLATSRLDGDDVRTRRRRRTGAVRRAARAARSRRSAICATARTRISGPRGMPVSVPARRPRPASAGRRSSRARSSRTRTCSISTRPRASCSSSTSRRRSSSSTPTRAAPPSARRRPRRTSARAKPIPCPPSAASSRSTAPIDLATAEAIASTRIDAVIAPAVDEAARAVLARKANMRVVIADFSGLGGGRGQGLPR